MKNFVKLTAFLISILLMLSMTACLSREDENRAREHISAFLDAVAIPDYERASSLVHPDADFDLEAFLEEAKNERSLDFSSGVEIVKYIKNKYIYKGNNTIYNPKIRVKVGDETVVIYVEVLINDEGYGINTIYFND